MVGRGRSRGRNFVQELCKEASFMIKASVDSSYILGAFLQGKATQEFQGRERIFEFDSI